MRRISLTAGLLVSATADTTFTLEQILSARSDVDSTRPFGASGWRRGQCRSIRGIGDRAAGGGENRIRITEVIRRKR